MFFFSLQHLPSAHGSLRRSIRTIEIEAEGYAALGLLPIRISNRTCSASTCRVVEASNPHPHFAELPAARWH